MSLNIKNEEVHALVREAAKLTGKSQVSVVEEAMRRYLDAVVAEHGAGGDADWDRALEIVRDMQQRIAAQGGLKMRPEDLYDPDTGLPA